MQRPSNTIILGKVTNWLKTSAGIPRRTIGINTFSDVNRGHSSCKCLHVVASELGNAEEFAKYTHSYHSHLHKTKWLFFLNSSAEEFFSPAFLPFSLEMLVVLLSDSSQANIFEVYRSHFSRPVRVLPMGTWDAKHGLAINNATVYQRRSDLEGISLRLGLIENWPISYEIKNGKWSGFFPKVWSQLELAINVSSSIHIKHSLTGSLGRNGSWSGLIGLAVSGKVDVVVSELTMNERRFQVLDFSQPLLKSKYQVFFKESGLVLNWLAVFKPFPKAIWQALLLWVVCASICMFFCHHVCLRTGLENRSCSLGLINFIYFILQSLCQQGQNEVPRSLTCRIIFVSSYLVAAVIIPTYSASLISSLTQKTLDRPFNSIEEMLNEGTFKLLVPNNTAEYDYFADTKDPTLSRAYNRLIQPVPSKHKMTSILGAVTTVCKEKDYAVFGIEAVLSRKIRRGPMPACNIISMLQPLSTVHLGMALPKNHPLHPLIKYHLSLMIETGVIHRIEAESWPMLSTALPDPWRQVRTEDVFHMFTFLACAIVVSFLIFIAEKIIYQQKKSHTTAPYYLEFVN